jgi:hypothetical protein
MSNFIHFICFFNIRSSSCSIYGVCFATSFNGIPPFNKLLATFNIPVFSASSNLLLSSERAFSLHSYSFLVSGSALNFNNFSSALLGSTSILITSLNFFSDTTRNNLPYLLNKHTRKFNKKKT